MLYDREREEKLDTNVIKTISQGFSISQEKVARLYEIVLKRLKQEARIKDFLSVLASKRVVYLIKKHNK